MQVPVARSITSATLSLLMFTTLLWGGCISCDQFFMVGSTATNCCDPDGHCKDESSPTRSDLSKECKQIAIEHSNFLDHTIVPPMARGLHTAILLVEHVTPVWASHFVEPSPPDRQALYSTFLV